MTLADRLRAAVLLAAMLAMGLVAAVYLHWSETIMPALAATDDRTFVVVEQRLDSAIFGPIFMGFGITGSLLLTGIAWAALAGTGTMVRFMLYRDRIVAPAWILGLFAMTVGIGVGLSDIYASPADREAVAESMASPAAVSMIGVNHWPDYHFGALMGHQMLWFSAIIVGVMSILLFVRHTRVEEATGRAELVRAGVLGRHASTVAAMIVVSAVNVVHAVAIAVGLGAAGLEGMTWSGSWLYGAGHAAVGVVFVGVAAITVQITEYSRGASGMAFAVLGLSYVLRAAGDVGDGTMSWFSPIGWAQATRVYADNLWWPVVLSLAVVAEVGSVPGDRIEHASVAGEDVIPLLARARVVVVTQPSLVAERDATPMLIGLLFTGAAILWAAASWVQGRLLEQVPRHRLVAAGAVVMAAAVTVAVAGALPGAPAPVAGSSMLIAAAGMGMLAPSLTVLSLAHSPGRQGYAGSAMQINQNLGQVVVLGAAAAVSNLSLALGAAAPAGYAAAFALLLVPCAGAAVLAARTRNT
jgi:uncharacterized membrane protein